MDLDSYLSIHQIIKVGIGYTDIIVDDPVDFILAITKMKYQIVEIMWWDRIEVKKSSDAIGYGGPLDPRNNKYFFSETDYSKIVDAEESSQSLIDSITFFQSMYKDKELYPSFSLKLLS